MNTEIPDSIFRKPRRMELKDAAKFDSLFWAQRDVLPLTEEEKTAYQKLDSTQSVEKQFTPSGPLVAVSNFLGKSPVAPQMRFNRAEGLFVGVSANFDSVTSQVAIRPEIGYGVSDEKPKGRLVLEYYFDRHRDYSFTFEGYQDISHFFGGEFHTDFSNVFSSLFYKIDYFDYYYTRGFAVTSSGRLLRDLVLTGSYRNEKQFLAIQRSNYSFFYRKNIYRVNPPIEEGVYRGIETKLRYGQDPAPVPIIPVNFVETQIVYSSSALGSAFNYTQILAKGEYHLATFFRSSLFPPSLMAKFSAGASFGTLTPQRYYTFDSPLLGFAPNGVLRGAGIKEFSGDTYYVLTVEQNFRSIPFLMLNIPFLYKNSIELLTFATVAQSWSSEAFVPSFIHAMKGIYAEAGISIGRLLGLFRLDYTYRITRPDRSVITVGISSLL